MYNHTLAFKLQLAVLQGLGSLCEKLDMGEYPAKYRLYEISAGLTSSLFISTDQACTCFLPFCFPMELIF